MPSATPTRRGAVPLYAAAVVVGLWRMWPRALAALRHLRLDMHVLVCLSAAGAAAIGQWAEAAAVAFLFAVAHRLEAWSLERARDALATVARRGVVSADSSQQSAPVERWIERFATIYTPAVTLAAVVVAVVPPLLDGQWAEWFYRALVFLVMACPCALVISTPVTVVAAVTALATRGRGREGRRAARTGRRHHPPHARRLRRGGRARGVRRRRRRDARGRRRGHRGRRRTTPRRWRSSAGRPRTPWPSSARTSASRS